MSRFEVDFDWVDLGTGAEDRAIKATFARVTIKIGDAMVTRLFDKQAKTTRDSAVVPLYPLAEWIVANWWPLIAEAEAPSRRTSFEDFGRRHNWRHGRDGNAFPNLRIHPEGEWTRLIWAPSPAGFQRVEFLESGTRLVKSDEFQRDLRDFVEAVIDRLAAVGVLDTWLQTEWLAIDALPEDERDFCLAAGRLGLDPFELPQSLRDEILNASARLPAHLLDEVVNASPRDSLATSVQWIETGLKAIQGNASVDGKLLALRQAIPVAARGDRPNELPWAAGYRYAKSLRDLLRLGDTALVDLDSIAGSHAPLIDAPQPPAPSFDGVMGVGQSSLCCYTAKRRPESVRFLRARGLLDFLFFHSDACSFYSSVQTSYQQRNRAFAAEFLAPADLIAKRLSGDEVSSEEIEDLASEFQVSPLVIDHQIRNHRLAKNPA